MEGQRKYVYKVINMWFVVKCTLVKILNLYLITPRQASDCLNLVCVQNPDEKIFCILSGAMTEENLKTDL